MDVRKGSERMRALKADEIEVRVNQVGVDKNGNGYVTLLLYKNARVDRAMLDEEFGAMNWQTKYSDHKGNLFCSIGVWDEKKKEWVWKEDCGTESNTEKEKGEASDAFKRAGFRWNVGVELYDSPSIFLSGIAVKAKSNGYGYELANKRELMGMYVSYVNIDKENNKINDLDIAQGGTVIWSTNRRKVGMKHE